MNPTSLIHPASSLDQITPSRIREVANVAFGMEGVYKLHFGESNMPTPPYIVDAAVKAMREGHTFYSENAGIPRLRQAIAEKYAELHGVSLDPANEIVITSSGVQALNLMIRCAINPGDEVIILTPNWPNGTEIVKLYGAIPIEVPFIVQAGRFTIDFAALEAAVTAKTRLLVYTSPSNPLGWVATVAEQQALLDFSRKHKLWLMADEVYERIYFPDKETRRQEPALSLSKGDKETETSQSTESILHMNHPKSKIQNPKSYNVAPSILRLCTRDDAVMAVQSFSKSYCMTGWRLGWAVSRRDLIQKAQPLNEFIISHAPTFIQHAGLAALQQGEDDIAARAELFHERMSFCYNALRSVKSIQVPKPDGAFYLFPRIEGLQDSFDFAIRLLKATKVSIAPGVAFGKGGEGAMRICCASDLSVLEPAMDRFCRFVEQG